MQDQLSFGRPGGGSACTDGGADLSNLGSSGLVTEGKTGHIRLEAVGTFDGFCFLSKTGSRFISR